ncbi:MAG: hypothetical protein ACOC4M_16315 [Promethearchaeia archaeon]
MNEKGNEVYFTRYVDRDLSGDTGDFSVGMEEEDTLVIDGKWHTLDVSDIVDQAVLMYFEAIVTADHRFEIRKEEGAVEQGCEPSGMYFARLCCVVSEDLTVDYKIDSQASVCGLRVVGWFEKVSLVVEVEVEQEIIEKRIKNILKAADKIPITDFLNYLKIDMEYFFNNLPEWREKYHIIYENDKIKKLNSKSK